MNFGRVFLPAALVLGCTRTAAPGSGGADAAADAPPELASEVALTPDATPDTPPDRDSLDGPTVNDSPDAALATDASDVSPPSDVPDAPRGEVSPGRCGAMVRACLCACGTDGPCQQRCIARSDDCAGCIFEASRRCCPEESMVLEDCIDRNRCPDDGCVRASCGVELRTYERCFEVRQASVETCANELRGCLGTDWPRVRCPGME